MDGPGENAPSTMTKSGLQKLPFLGHCEHKAVDIDSNCLLASDPTDYITCGSTSALMSAESTFPARRPMLHIPSLTRCSPALVQASSVVNAQAVSKSESVSALVPSLGVLPAVTASFSASGFPEFPQLLVASGNNLSVSTTIPDFNFPPVSVTDPVLKRSSPASFPVFPGLNYETGSLSSNNMSETQLGIERTQRNFSFFSASCPAVTASLSATVAPLTQDLSASGISSSPANILTFKPSLSESISDFTFSLSDSVPVLAPTSSPTIPGFTSSFSTSVPTLTPSFSANVIPALTPSSLASVHSFKPFVSSRLPTIAPSVSASVPGFPPQASLVASVPTFIPSTSIKSTSASTSFESLTPLSLSTSHNFENSSPRTALTSAQDTQDTAPRTLTITGNSSRLAIGEQERTNPSDAGDSRSTFLNNVEESTSDTPEGVQEVDQVSKSLPPDGFDFQDLDCLENLPDVVESLSQAQKQQYAEIERQYRFVHEEKEKLQKEQEKLTEIQKELSACKRSICLAEEERSKVDQDCKRLHADVEKASLEGLQNINKIQNTKQKMQDDTRLFQEYLTKMDDHRELVRDSESSLPIHVELAQQQDKVQALQTEEVAMENELLGVNCGKKEKSQRQLEDEIQILKNKRLEINSAITQTKKTMANEDARQACLKQDTKVLHKRNSAQLTRLKRQLKETQLRNKQWHDEACQLEAQIEQLRKFMEE